MLQQRHLVVTVGSGSAHESAARAPCKIAVRPILRLRQLTSLGDGSVPGLRKLVNGIGTLLTLPSGSVISTRHPSANCSTSPIIGMVPLMITVPGRSRFAARSFSTQYDGGSNSARVPSWMSSSVCRAEPRL